jgi:hypothetical protein
MSPIQRLLAYSTIKIVLDEMDAYITEHQEDQFKHSKADEYVVEMYYPLESIVGLENNGHDDTSNFIWLTTGIDKLRSQFGLNIEES